MIRAGNRYLEALGYTDHGPRHVSYVSRTASGILKALGYSPREVELAAIAGWVHDVGNSVNRHNHGPNGAIMLLPILKDAGMEMNDVMEIITAVGNHEEQSGTISSAVSAALAGTILTSNVNSAKYNVGSGYTLAIITAVVLGGTLNTGGKGSILGTVLASLIICILRYGLPLCFDVSTQNLDLPIGIVLVLVVLGREIAGRGMIARAVRTLRKSAAAS